MEDLGIIRVGGVGCNTLNRKGLLASCGSCVAARGGRR
jgi:hypothetical protein